MKYLLTLFIVLLIPSAAFARGECKEERQKFCAGVERPHLRACLTKHEAQLGAPCKSRLEKTRAKAKEGPAKKEVEGSRAEESTPSAASGANYSSPSTDTQPQPTYPDGEPQ